MRRSSRTAKQSAPTRTPERRSGERVRLCDLVCRTEGARSRQGSVYRESCPSRRRIPVLGHDDCAVPRGPWWCAIRSSYRGSCVRKARPLPLLCCVTEGARVGQELSNCMRFNCMDYRSNVTRTRVSRGLGRPASRPLRRSALRFDSTIPVRYLDKYLSLDVTRCFPPRNLESAKSRVREMQRFELSNNLPRLVAGGGVQLHVHGPLREDPG